MNKSVLFGFIGEKLFIFFIISKTIKIKYILKMQTSGISMSNIFVIFQPSVMYIKCNVIHFNSMSDMVQVSSF